MNTQKTFIMQNNKYTVTTHELKGTPKTWVVLSGVVTASNKEEAYIKAQEWVKNMEAEKGCKLSEPGIRRQLKQSTKGTYHSA